MKSCVQVQQGQCSDASRVWAHLIELLERVGDQGRRVATGVQWHVARHSNDCHSEVCLSLCQFCISLFQVHQDQCDALEKGAAGVGFMVSGDWEVVGGRIDAVMHVMLWCMAAATVEALNFVLCNGSCYSRLSTMLKNYGNWGECKG